MSIWMKLFLTCPFFCHYIKTFVDLELPEEEDPQDTAIKLMEKDFVCQHIISMTSLYDLSDEVCLLL